MKQFAVADVGKNGIVKEETIRIYYDAEMMMRHEKISFDFNNTVFKYFLFFMMLTVLMIGFSAGNIYSCGKIYERCNIVKLPYSETLG